MNLLLAKGLLAASLMGNPAQVESVYQPAAEIPTEVCMVNPDGHDKDKHDKHDGHDKDKHDGKHEGKHG